MREKTEFLSTEKCREIGQSCVCFNLRRAARSITRFYDKALQPIGIRSTQLSVLMTIKLKKDGIVLSKLAKATMTERTTLTRNLAVLQKNGLITIEAGEDRREKFIKLTQPGEETLLKAVPIWEAAQKSVAEQLDDGRIGSLLKELSAVTSISMS